ncbi:PREDICTED: probable RISC-loading complex subunit BRAFLDRAFT_242885 [Vollenhovia emeryi]|uniref:probable RISC-loading complex subunit BRAFLDRAFT_242885 n=1 Tax=Vollenhovia emeryi TaxID=411798 RepID=UPI0005F54249|nr:PREDICTED: probable RISC-loading complex subunit BRAFLDRAFT_242885 [Vollenhovia emeryi]
MSKTPVSILQEMMVKQGMTPDYELIHDGGGRHVNTFTYRVTCDGLSATGTGRCKKDAKHEAAKFMLTEIAAHRNYPQLTAANTPTVSPSRSPFHCGPPPPKMSNMPFFNSVGELQELCMINNLHDPEYILIRDIGPPHARVFTIRCKISNFEEDGTATTKKQAKHDAAKRMVDRIKGLVDNSEFYKQKSNEEEFSTLSIATLDTELLNRNAEERYCALTKAARKINLGIKLSEYHIKWKDSSEAERIDKILEHLEHMFPTEFFKLNEFVTEEFIQEKIDQLSYMMREIDVTIIVTDLPTHDDLYFMKSIQITTCPVLTQIGRGKSKVEAFWSALTQTIEALKLLLF